MAPPDVSMNSISSEETVDISDGLEDIRLTGDDSKIVFKKYRPMAEIGELILKDMIDVGYDRNRKGFFLSENDTSIGIISQCNGLYAMSLLRKFGVNLKPCEDIISDVLNDIFNRVYRDDHKLVFDASPYVKQSEDTKEVNQIEDYTETIALVLSTMIEFRGTLLSQKERNMSLEITVKDVDDPLKKIEETIQNSMVLLNESAIKWIRKKDGEKEETPRFRIKDVDIDDFYSTMQEYQYRGWNFAKCTDESEMSSYVPSLYTNYVVSQAYMSFFEEFENQIEIARDKIRQVKKISKERMKRLEGEYGYKEDKEFFTKIEKQYNEFRKRCVDMGRIVDTRIRGIDISENFIGSGYTRVPPSKIISNTYDESLFNTLMVVCILINCGVDLDYMEYGKKKKHKDNSEHTRYLEMLQYALQNTQKMYDFLSVNNKENIVEEYIVAITEDIPSSMQKKAKIIRKQRISTLKIVPLILQTYNSISKYLIKYPQKQASAYLKTIMGDRVKEEDEEQRWSWDDDEYNVVVNRYYIEALKSFYQYYFEYELSYSDIEKEISDRINEHTRDFEQKERILRDQISDLKSDLDKEVGKKVPLVEEIKKITYESMDSVFEKKLIDTLTRIVDTNKNAGNNTLADPLSKVFMEALISNFDEVILTCINPEKNAEREYIEKRDRLIKIMRSELKKLLMNEYGIEEG